MAVIAIVYSWVVFALFKAMKTRKLLAGGISLLLAIPVILIVNYTLLHMIGEPMLDLWDTVAWVIIVVPAIHLFIMDYNVRKKAATSKSTEEL
jgi:hypothetical protein